METDYLQINKDCWNKRTEVHVKSEFYDMDGFMSGQSSLKSIELDLLGDVKGKTVLHLQCHFGQDSISIARMGARVTGIDLSDKAIDIARELSLKTKTGSRFICSDVYDLPNHLKGQFDVIFTSYGVIGWLPDMDKWASVINHFLKPGGKLVFVEFHPVVWMFDNAFENITYSYFKADPIVETSTGTYTNENAPISYQEVSWNHGMAEVIGSLLKQGLQITHLSEYDYSPYPCFKEMEEQEPGKYYIKNLGNRIPMVYALTAEKK